MRKVILSVFFFCLTACWLNFAYAAKVLNLDQNSSLPLTSKLSITRIAVGSSAIATVRQISTTSSKEILIVAKSPGTTTLFIWTEDGERHDYVINVSSEDIGLALAIEEAIGLPDVHVKKVNDRILLTGKVENQYERNYALQVARLYIGGDANINLSVGTGPDLSMKTASSSSNGLAATITIGGNETKVEGQVIDLLQMRNPTQVRLEAQVIAIRPEDRQNLGILYGNEPSSAPGVFYLGESYGTGTSFRHNPLEWLTDRHSPINVQIQALVTKRKAKILSRPSIMTMSGEVAMIQVGGEIPYTTTTSSGVQNTSFKQYGIILQFKPVVDAENRIVSGIHAEVSNMSGETVDGQPILASRTADSVVTMTDGSTVVIGGLIDSSEQKNVTKIPLLGDIPIIGEFFKYTSKTKDKQELIILVTPHIVKMADSSRARMSEEMEALYRGGQKERNAMREVDLNEEFIE